MERINKYRLDLRGMLLPLSLLKVTQSFRALKPGETLEVLFSGPESSQELLKVLPQASYELTATEAQGRSNSHYCIQLQKKELRESV